MDRDKIISSGILELYVLGTATADEVRQVNDILFKHPELKKEIEEIELTLISEAESHASAFTDSVKEKRKEEIILQAGISESAFSVLSKNTNKNNRFYYAIAASLALLILGISFTYVFFSKWQTAKQQLAQSELDKIELADQLKMNQNLLENLTLRVEVLSDPGNKVIHLNGMGTQAGSSALVFWNVKSEKVFISESTLAELPADKQYQLWALVDGKPVDMGVFNALKNSEIQTMKSIPRAQTFAVTVENKGGSAAPTMDAMVLIGNI